MCGSRAVRAVPSLRQNRRQGDVFGNQAPPTRLPLAVVVTMATFSATSHRRSGRWLPKPSPQVPGDAQPRMRAPDAAGSAIVSMNAGTVVNPADISWRRAENHREQRDDHEAWRPRRKIVGAKLATLSPHAPVARLPVAVRVVMAAFSASSRAGRGAEA